MDFIFGLYLTLEKLNSVWVIVDQLTEWVHFILLKVNNNMKKLAKTYNIEIFRLHGASVAILSDKGTQFTSGY